MLHIGLQCNTSGLHKINFTLKKIEPASCGLPYLFSLPEHGSVPGMREKYIFMYLYTNVKHNFQIAYF